MRTLKRALLGALLLALGLSLVQAQPASAAGGPVILMGIDAEDGGVGGHGPIVVYRDVVNSLRGQTTNGGTGILVIGGGKSATDNVTAFWNAIGTQTGAPITYVNGAPAISGQSLAGFQVVAVVSTVDQTLSGGLTDAESTALNGRQAAIATHVNGGGGLFGLSQTGAPVPYGYLAGVGTFTSSFADYDNITPTAAGTGVGITNALDICCWHDQYETFPSFLGVLATNASTGKPAAIGGANVVVPTNISLDPPADTNPVGTPHTVTATVRDSQGNPFPDQVVTFSVSGANGGAAGTCNPPTCTTNAAGQVSFTYTGSNVGPDTIDACFQFQGANVCTSASKTWFSPVTVSVNDVSVNEGDSGLTNANFTISLNQPAPAGGVMVTVSTANGTALAGSDYLARTNVVVTVPAGQSSATFTVQVIGDTTNELNETFTVNLANPVNGSVNDGIGVGTIIDDDRNGAFSCRASALRVRNTETAVANAPNAPCVDGNQTVLTAVLSASAGLGAVNVNSGTLNANTNQTPDNLEATAPAATDNAVATSTVERATVSALGLVNISATAVRSEAKVQCTAGPTGALSPTFSSSSSIAALRINGLSVNVNGSLTIPLPLGLGSVQINRTVTTPTSVTQQAIRIVLLGVEVVVAEAKANFSGNPCAQ